MSFFKKAAIAAVMGGALVSMSAQAAFISYWFDADGAAGAGKAVRVNEYLDITSGFLGHNYDYAGTSYKFDQYGLARINGLDSALDPFGGDTVTAAAFGNVRAKYFGSGTGDLSAGSFNFASGKIQFFNPAYTNMFVEFSVVGGSGLLDGSGVPNGKATLIASVSAVSAGYFFSDNAGVQGDDVANLPVGQLKDVFGFSTTNASLISNQGALNSLNSSLKTAYSDSFVQGSTAANTFTDGKPDQFYVGANGQFRLNQVPEPASLALVGLGLLAAGVARRRASK